MKYKIEFVIDTSHDYDVNTLGSFLEDRLPGKISEASIEKIGAHFHLDCGEKIDRIAIDVPEDAENVEWDVQHQDHYPHTYRLCLEYWIPDGTFGLTESAAYSEDFKHYGFDIERLKILGMTDEFKGGKIPGRKFIVLENQK